MDEKENNQSTSPGSGRDSSSGSYSSCSTPEEVDVVAFTPRPQPVSDDDQKRYFCQRCLNHAQEHPRKGHKPFCQYANCECADCQMVEERRRLNNMLSLRRLDPNHATNRTTTGKKIRDPKCALCSAHGNKQPLRGHKKARCPFLKCGCHLCGLVENRRTLMARQIKLRRDQQKQRKAQLNAAAAAAAAASSTTITTTIPTIPSNNPPSKRSNLDNEQRGRVSPTPVSKAKIDEPVRVPPLMPMFSKAQMIEPQPPVPVIVQPTPLLPTAATAPMFITPPVENIDLHFMPLNYHLMNPLPFQFAPVLPYVPTLPFLAAP